MRAMPPLKDAEVKVFQLVHTPAGGAAAAIQSIFGDQQVRLGVDDRSNSLIVSGTADALNVVEAILLRLDESADKKNPPDGDKRAEQTSRQRRLHCF